MNKLAIIGYFAGGNPVSDGQGVKTKILTEEIEQALGKENVLRIDTFGWRRNPLALFWNCVKAVRTHPNVLFLTDEGGIKVFPRLLTAANLGKRCKIHYYVVGGWLGEYLSKDKRRANVLKKLDAIYVEVPAMQRELERFGFQNTVLVNKFRRLTPVASTELELCPQEPYRLCYFSRVMEEKGIEYAIEAVKQANEGLGRTKYTLDIFGTVHPPYQARFDELQHAFPEYIAYRGVVDFQKSGSVLKDYFAMLFPTFYASEGYPNALVDAFAAGLPVIATRWNYNAEIIHDGVDGILVDVGSVEQLVAGMESLSADLRKYAGMRTECLSRCTEYLPEQAISRVISNLK